MSWSDLVRMLSQVFAESLEGSHRNEAQVSNCHHIYIVRCMFEKELCLVPLRILTADLHPTYSFQGHRKCFKMQLSFIFCFSEMELVCGCV